MLAKSQTENQHHCSKESSNNNDKELSQNKRPRPWVFSIWKETEAQINENEALSQESYNLEGHTWHMLSLRGHAVPAVVSH